MTSLARSLLLVVLVAGCEDQKCDTDQRYSHGLCYEVATDAPVDSAFAHFGDICVDDTGCAAPALYCARDPASPTGYCTVTGCLADATLCPPMWTCLDLSVFSPGLPAICKKP